jgi:formylglycine-generating enzyme required for sulfatase activity
VRELAYGTMNSVTYSAIQAYWAMGGASPLPTVVPMTPLPPGRTFTMGCLPGRDLLPGMAACPAEEPPREGPMEDPCAMGETEVTNLQFARYLWARNGFRWTPLGAHSGNGRLATPNRPVVNVSFSDARVYAEWLRQTQGPGWRLPTEAEWEYAARATEAAGPFPWGREDPEGRARFASASTAAVGSYAPVHGLYDMAGNVWEWTDAPSAEGSVAAGTTRVARGGSWFNGADWLRAAHRLHYPSDAFLVDVGFRVCRSAPVDPPPAGAPGAASRTR